VSNPILAVEGEGDYTPVPIEKGWGTFQIDAVKGTAKHLHPAQIPPSLDQTFSEVGAGFGVTAAIVEFRQPCVKKQ
jgi:hypothetical protein